MAYKNVADAHKRLEKAGYIPSREIATVVFLAQATQKPVSYTHLTLPTIYSV